MVINEKVTYKLYCIDLMRGLIWLSKKHALFYDIYNVKHNIHNMPWNDFKDLLGNG